MSGFESFVAAGVFGFLCGGYGYLLGTVRERARATEHMVDEWREYRDSFFARVMRASNREAAK